MGTLFAVNSSLAHPTSLALPPSRPISRTFAVR